MKRFSGLVCATLVVVVALGAVARAGEPNPRPKGPLSRPGQPGMVMTAPGNVFYMTNNFGMPGYPLLQSEYVQKELDLSAEQKEKLADLAKKAMEPPKDEPAFDWQKFSKMKPEEQQKFQKERMERFTKRGEETKKQIEQVLTPKQLKKLKKIEFQQRGAMMLASPYVAEQLGLSDDQKQQLQKIREEQQGKIMQVQRENEEKTLGVLNPDQTKKLKELSEKGMSAWGEMPQRQPRAKKDKQE
jgi:hypothetical protein